MNDLMSMLMSQYTPPMNPVVMNGISTLHMKQKEAYLDQVLKGLNKSQAQYGLQYVGYERCTAEEEYAEATRIRNNKRIYDLAKSDIYLVRLKYELHGKPIVPDRYVYLPFSRKAGLQYISGSLYHSSPVHQDKVISPDSHSVFVRLLRDKITFRRAYHYMMINGNRETSLVCWSPIYRKPTEKRKIPQTTKALTSTAHYLFAKFGFSGAFMRFTNYVPLIGEGGFNSETHPPKDWVLCESASAYSYTKPRTYIGDYYVPTKLQLAIPREKWDPMMQSLVEGFFYVVDHFPERLTTMALDDTTTWMVLLGHIVFSGLFGENKLYADIAEHFNSLDNCIDPIIAEKLTEIGYDVDNFYDLTAMIMGSWNALITKNDRSNLSMYGKNLEVLYYILYPITSSIFLTNFKLNKFAMKKQLTAKDVTEIFNRNLRVRAVFDLSSGSIVTESVSYSGDHMYPKITSKLTSQENWSGQNKGKSKRLVIGPDQHIDTSQVEMGTTLFLSKSNPASDTKLSMWANINLETNTLEPDPQHVEVLSRTQALLDKK